MFKRSTEHPERVYIWFFNRRLIFENGKYVGFYHPKLKKVV